jgi:hypothetical protein
MVGVGPLRRAEANAFSVETTAMDLEANIEPKEGSPPGTGRSMASSPTNCWSFHNRSDYAELKTEKGAIPQSLWDTAP